MEQLSQIFKKNRAEELPDDLWENFVLPINYEQYNLLKETKSVKVVGGRGTGKTMYLKYHAFSTQFSSKREQIPESTLDVIGIYWKPDTHFVQLINENYIGKEWNSIFNTYVALSLLSKFSEFAKTFLKSNYSNKTLKSKIENFIIPNILSSELSSQSLTLIELKQHVRGLLYKLQNWLHSPLEKFPIVLDAKATINYLVNELTDTNLLNCSSFHIFIDEFENFREEQQKIINTWMKHGEKPLLFSVAFKKHATVSKKTTGNENIQQRNDHRIIDLVDDIYAKNESEFKILAAEIIANKIHNYSNTLVEFIDPKLISDQTMLDKRRSPAYKKAILNLATKIFPQLTYEELAQQMLNDTTLSDKIKKNIKQALKEKKSDININIYFDNNFPKETVVNSILLFRKTTKPQELANTFEEYKQGINNKKTIAYKEQVSNSIVGAILYIYSSFPKRICPIYAGFDRFCTMSKNNLRHLLELCYQSFIELENNSKNLEKIKNTLPIVKIDLQLKAAKFCSKQELDTISELGPYGQDLQKIAHRLGRIFYLKQKIRTQSQPENIHFSVETLSLQTLDSKVTELLYQAKLWNVIQEYDETTKDTENNLATKEYMLTPILAPYYKITMRKIHKIVFSIPEFKIIFLESDDSYEKLYESFIQKWKIDEISEDKTKDLGLFGEQY